MLISIVILAIIAVVTSIKLYQIGKEPVAPTVPEPVPAAEPEPTPVPACTLEFTIAGPTLTPSPTPTPTPTPTLTPTPSPAVTPTPTGVPPTVTPTPPISCTGECMEIKVYDDDENWNEITDFSTLTVGQKILFAVKGNTNCPSGFTKGRFRINGGIWQKTTAKDSSGDYYYIRYTIAAAGSYKVEGMLFCPDFGDNGEWR